MSLPRPKCRSHTKNHRNRFSGSGAYPIIQPASQSVSQPQIARINHIGPHQCDVEIISIEKSLVQLRDSNQGLKSESPVLYHYTNNSPIDKSKISMTTQGTQITVVMSKAYLQVGK